MRWKSASPDDVALVDVDRFEEIDLGWKSSDQSAPKPTEGLSQILALPAALAVCETHEKFFIDLWAGCSQVAFQEIEVMGPWVMSVKLRVDGEAGAGGQSMGRTSVALSLVRGENENVVGQEVHWRVEGRVILRGLLHLLGWTDSVSAGE